MSIFSNWGKNKENDEEKQEQIDKASEEYNKQKEEFEKRIRVDVPQYPEHIETKEDTSGSDDPDKGQQERDLSKEQKEEQEKNDDCVR